MRLKFLFFPIILIISISLFIGFIWPEITKIQTLEKSKNDINANLQDIQNKKNAISQIKTKINNSGDSESLVDNYLPENKSEEKIINNVNFLATSSGVSLVNISVKDQAQITPTNTQISNVNVETASTSTSTGTGKDALLDETTIVVNGDYDKIKLFLDQLEKISIYNKIKSVTITSQETQGEGENKPKTFISANIVVNFGYVNSSKINGVKLAVTQPKLDEEVIQVLKDYVSDKSPVFERDAAERINPFMAN